MILFEECFNSVEGMGFFVGSQSRRKNETFAFATNSFGGTASMSRILSLHTMLNGHITEGIMVSVGLRGFVGGILVSNDRLRDSCHAQQIVEGRFVQTFCPMLHSTKTSSHVFVEQKPIRGLFFEPVTNGIHKSTDGTPREQRGHILQNASNHGKDRNVVFDPNKDGNKKVSQLSITNFNAKPCHGCPECKVEDESVCLEFCLFLGLLGHSLGSFLFFSVFLEL